MFHSSTICGWAARSYEIVQLGVATPFSVPAQNIFIHSLVNLYGHSKWTCFSVSMETVNSSIINSNYSK